MAVKGNKTKSARRRKSPGAKARGNKSSRAVSRWTHTACDWSLRRQTVTHTCSAVCQGASLETLEAWPFLGLHPRNYLLWWFCVYFRCNHSTEYNQRWAPESSWWIFKPVVVLGISDTPDKDQSCKQNFSGDGSLRSARSALLCNLCIM